jgi:hypothetical protein
VPNRKEFHEFIQVRNLREGPRDGDQKMWTVFCDIVVGPLTLKGVNYQWHTGSIHFNQGRRLNVKASYVKVFKQKITDAIKEMRDGAQTKPSEQGVES